MAFESEMEGGYPSETVIDDYLADRGFEIPTRNNPDFHLEFKQMLWRLLNDIDHAGVGAVYAVTAQTITVRGGAYRYNGVAKTLATPTAIDPADDDTTYVWLTAANAIASGIDGDDWPVTEHVKLAEVDVDATGVITEIRDMRARDLGLIADNAS